MLLLTQAIVTGPPGLADGGTVPMSMPPSSRDRRSAPLSSYEEFDWRTMPLPASVAAIICRPRYDESFDICEFMRESGYPGTFRLPKNVLTVKKHANPTPVPCGEVISTGDYRGRRDYLEYLGYATEPEEQCRCRRTPYSVEDGYVDGLPFVRRNLRQQYGLADYKNNYLAGMMDRRPTRLRSGMRQGAVASRSDSSTFPTSHISQHTAASRSSSSHHVGPVSEVALNMFATPNQQTWTEAAPPTPMNSGYVGVGGYDAAVGYSSVGGAVPTQVPCGMPQMMNPDVQVIEPPPVNQGNMQNPEMGDVNEFFVTNVFQEREPSNSMPAQVGSPPMGNYQNDAAFKPENVEYAYEGGQMYPPVLTQPVYQPQHEPPVVRTAAGGECDGIIKFEEPSDYEQPHQEAAACGDYQYAAAAEEFANYEAMHGMQMTQQVHTIGRVENIYATTDNTQPYSQASAERVNNDGSQYSAQKGESASSTTLDTDKYIKEDSEESSDDSNIDQSFFSD